MFYISHIYLVLMTVIFRVLLKLPFPQQRDDFILCLKRLPCLAASHFAERGENVPDCERVRKGMRLACVTQRCALAG